MTKGRDVSSQAGAEPQRSSTPLNAAAPRISLALSGGGSRAIAFHLGCLRALRDFGVLDRVATISSVSGGTVLAALYCSTQGDFEAFEAKTRRMLRKGMVMPALSVAFTTLEAPKAIASWGMLAGDRAAALLFRTGLMIVTPVLRKFGIKANMPWLSQPLVRRWASRTTILRRAFDQVFGGVALGGLRNDRPRLVIVACELRAKAAFYFTSSELRCWRYGKADSAGVPLATAVVASAAYPMALPALDEIMEFEKGGDRTLARVVLTDGGVYDNLGLSPLWPDRDPSIGLDTGVFDVIIACRAGYGLEVGHAPAFAPSRITGAFESVFARSQNQTMQRLFDLQQAGKITSFLLLYLGQDDGRLPDPSKVTVTREMAAAYPTNFSAMPEEWVNRLVARGEQLTRALLEGYGVP